MAKNQPTTPKLGNAMPLGSSVSVRPLSTGGHLATFNPSGFGSNPSEAFHPSNPATAMKKAIVAGMPPSVPQKAKPVMPKPMPMKPKGGK